MPAIHAAADGALHDPIDAVGDDGVPRQDALVEAVAELLDAAMSGIELELLGLDLEFHLPADEGVEIGFDVLDIRRCGVIYCDSG